MAQLTTEDVLLWLETIQRQHGAVPLWVVYQPPGALLTMAPIEEMRLDTSTTHPVVLLLGAGVELCAGPLPDEAGQPVELPEPVPPRMETATALPPRPEEARWN